MSCCTKTGNGVIGYADSRGEWSLYLSLVVRACPIFALRTFIFSVCRLLKQTNAALNGLMFWGVMLHENVRACLVESDNYVGG